MTKNIDKDYLIELPSGAVIHPCRLIHRDGTLMWKDALISHNVLYIPETHAIEQHIIKTAHRLEELNLWISQDLEPWEGIKPLRWLYPVNKETAEGICVYFKHRCINSEDAYKILEPHIQDHETLEYDHFKLFFRRC